MELTRMARRAPGFLAAFWWLRGCDLGKLVWTGGRVRAEPRGTIRIADRVQLHGGMIASELICEEGGDLSVGPGCVFNYGVSIRAERSVRIGESCWLGTLVLIRDSDGRTTAPVVIGDRVWLAHGAIVGPGVHIGNDAVVGAGSVVLSDVPPNTLASGNPARCVPLQFFAPQRTA